MTVQALIKRPPAPAGNHSVDKVADKAQSLAMLMVEAVCAGVCQRTASVLAAAVATTLHKDDTYGPLVIECLLKEAERLTTGEINDKINRLLDANT